MSLLIENVTEAALSLPSEERAILADRLVDSLDSGADLVELHEQHMAEVRRRVEEMRSGKVEGIDSEVVFDRIDKILAK
jgi:putative addiction module component (TIGR02574 family)